MLLDPLLARAPVPAAATGIALAREPRQERAASQPGSARHSPASAASVTRVVRVPESVARTLPAADQEIAPLPTLAALPVMEPTAFHPVAAQPAVLAVAAATAGKSPPASSSSVGGLWSLAAAALALGVVIALAAIARRRDKSPEIPQWTRSRSLAGPRSMADLSTATMPSTFSRAAATTMQGGTAGAKPKPAPTRSSLHAQTVAPPSRRGPATVDPSTIDTLLDALNPDIVEERAVREAFAAARSDVEREMDGNAILKAIDAAERDLHLLSSETPQSAIERALEDDLLQPPHRR